MNLAILSNSLQKITKQCFYTQADIYNFYCKEVQLYQPQQVITSY